MTDKMKFIPEDGLLNVASYPTQPANENEAREQVQRGMNQLRDFINDKIIDTKADQYKFSDSVITTDNIITLPSTADGRMKLSFKGRTSGGKSSKPVVRVHKKNLFDKNDNRKLVGFSINATGNIASSPTVTVSPMIVIEGGKTYTKSNDGSGRVRLFDENENFISVHAEDTVATPSNARYYQFAYITANEDIVQVEEGSQATEYETPFNSVFRCPVELHQLPNGIRDSYDMDSGIHAKSVNKVQGLPVDLVTSRPNEDLVRMVTLGFVPESLTLHHLNHTIELGGSASSNRNWDYAYIVSSGAIWYQVPKGQFASLSDAQTYFMNNPFIIIYQLATPQTIQLSPASVAATPNGTLTIEGVAPETTYKYPINYGGKIDSLVEAAKSLGPMGGIVGSMVGKTIEESGSNSNGTYIKFADGTAICTISKSFENVAVTSTYGSVFLRNETFSSLIPLHLISEQKAWLSATGSTQYIMPVLTSISTSVNCRFLSPISGTSTITLHILVTGRWK